MVYRVLADLVLGIHLAFVLFVVLGGLLALRWRQSAWIHVPAALWGAFIEFSGGICPLTPLENWLRERGGTGGYSSSFIEHTILPVLYPTELTRELQIALGASVVAINFGIYGWIMRRAVKNRASAPRATSP
jgi:hypothetical protein